MKLLLYYTIIIFLSSTFSRCTLMNYDYSSAPLSQEEKDNKKVQDSIQAILTKKHATNYISYTFSQLRIDKPAAFITLDSLYTERRQIVKQKKALKNSYDSLLAISNEKIETQKEKINQNKLYHTYEMEHVFLVKSDDNYILYEKAFTLFPNYSLKDSTTKLVTTLTPKEQKLFDYFSYQNPLFETEDPHYNNQMDQLVYERFNNALTNAIQHKAALLHTLLYSIEYIRKYNAFNERDIAQEMARRWLIKNGFNQFNPKFGKLEKTLNNYEVSGYTMEVLDRKSSQTITFTFDLNLVITNTSKL